MSKGLVAAAGSTTTFLKRFFANSLPGGVFGVALTMSLYPVGTPIKDVFISSNWVPAVAVKFGIENGGMATGDGGVRI